MCKYIIQPTSSDLPQNCICDINPLTLRFNAPHCSQPSCPFFFFIALDNTLFNNFISFSKSCNNINRKSVYIINFI